MRVILKDSHSFKKLLVLKGYSQRGFGRAVGISAGYASQVSNGMRCPSASVAKRITEVLEIEFGDIFFIDDDCNSNQNNSA
ncbi:helix-turn-helix transcriptional regulator [Alicyclobacillus sp. SO9]|uniref:helix-turn-helix domain-containing protein n=1 Tax=Alicyclobacillus sp. SO9 TaxID=2665646 RepID=UPI0018E823CC|nr:helix-turn-helix transcriptional regulator [Alicyclobacillus sp. SO9]QQE80883.1 helix-turn-helix transcriptional regulator [Alicyclobacillus sp. SO9]